MIASIKYIDFESGLVEASCHMGSFYGIWKSRQYTSFSESLFHIEISIYDPVIYDENTFLTTKENGFYQIEESRNLIVSDVESIEEDSVAFLRISPDCLIMTEALIGNSILGKKIEVSLDMRGIHVFPTGIISK